MAGIGGFAAYSLLYAPVWTESLSVKNSTGQYEKITIYRNATDVNASVLKAFMASENTTLKAALFADNESHQVEYAVQLHDDAERAKINCSLSPLDISDGYPGHVVIAFHTKDDGMVFVDPASMNVSAADFPGIDYSRLVFLRDQWIHALPAMNDRNQTICVTEYRSAHPVSYGELLQFLAGDDTENTTYKNGSYTCSDYAIRLHDNAEAVGIASGIVCVSFGNGQPGHGFNAFPTTDMGVVYVDDTGLNDSGLQQGYMSHDNVVYMMKNAELGEFPIGQVNGSLDYDFYLGMRNKIEAYRESVLQYAGDKQALESDLEAFQNRVAANNAFYNQYASGSEQLNAAIRQYKADFQNRTTSWPELVAWSKRLDDNYSTYITTYNQLESQRQSLNSRLSDLNGRYEHLTTCEESKWVSYYPQGIVSNYELYW